MLTFSVEKLEDIWDEKCACGQDHWEGTEMCKDGEVLAPLLSRYKKCQDDGYYFEIVARSESGEIAGFCGMYLTPSMHTQQMLATEDVLYLKQKFRVGRNGLRFYKFVEEEMKRRGAGKIIFTAPVESVANRLATTAGAKHVFNGYSKILT